ncbi:MAG: hypothetical protein PHS31_10765, partial [Victivallaceae bacterium]|nr:hypothetical protein [Victivallaceae bacterium]
MFSSKFVTLIVAMLCVSVVCYAGRYEDTIQEVELNIKEKYRTPRAVEEAQKRLGLIIDNPDLSEDAKIIALHRTFLQKEKIEITEANAHQLIFVPDISWTIHSIAIAYDVDKTQEILVSGQKIDAE